MHLVEIASALRSSRCNWKAKRAGEVKHWEVVSQEESSGLSLRRAGFALWLWEKASGQIPCSNDVV